jgi:D-amino-acid dehydrogenase
MLPDGLPAIGPVRQFPNLFVATGHAMLGITLAPATAQVVAGMMFGESPSIDISPFAADRYNRRAGRSNTRTAGTVA